MDVYIAMSVRFARSYGCALRVSRCALVVCFIVLMLSRYNTYDNDTMLQYTYMYSILHGRFSCVTA